MKGSILILIANFCIIHWVHAGLFIPDTLSGRARTEYCKHKGNSYVISGSLDSAILYYNEGLRLVDKTTDKILIASIHNNLGVALTKQGNYLAGIESYEQSLIQYQETGNDTLLGQSCLNLGIVYKEWNALESSMSHLIMAAKIFEKLGLQKELGSSYNALGNLHLDLKEFDSALDYLQKGLDVRIKINNQYGVAGSYNSLARYYEQINDPENALKFAFKAMHEKQSLNNPKYNASSFFRIGEILRKMNQLDSAYIYSKKALEIRKTYNHTSGIAISHIELGKIFLGKNQLDSAIYHLEKGYLLLDSVDNISFLMEAATFLRDGYLKAGNHIMASQIGSRLIHLQDAFNASERERRAIEMEVKYRISKKDDELLLQNIQITNLRTTMVLILLVVLSLVIILCILFYYNRKTSKQKGIIESQRNEIKLHHIEYQHRIKNNLATFSGMLSLVQESSDNQDLITAIDTLDQRMQAINLVNQNLDRWNKMEADQILLNYFISDLLNDLMVLHGFNENKLHLELSPRKVHCPRHLLLPIAIIINEVFTNAFKYAIPQSKNPILRINIIKDSNQIKISIEDNGPGLTEENSINRGSGRNLINSFAQDLKAFHSFHSTKDGLKFEITIPI